MIALWESLSLFQQILVLLIVPSTLILVIQLLLLLFGVVGAEDVDFDADTDIDIDIDDLDLDGDGIPDVEPDDGESLSLSVFGGLRLFTFRGAMMFFAVGGWSALAVSMGDSVFWAVVAGVLAGALADFIYALLLKSMSKLQESGTIDMTNAIGLFGEVYIPVPGDRAGAGRVNVELQGKLCELEAVTNESEPIKTGTRVIIRDVDGDTLIVKTASVQ